MVNGFLDDDVHTSVAARSANFSTEIFPVDARIAEDPSVAENANVILGGDSWLELRDFGGAVIGD